MSARLTLVPLPTGKVLAVLEMPEGTTALAAEEVRAELGAVWDGPVLVVADFGGLDVRVVQAEAPELPCGYCGAHHQGEDRHGDGLGSEDAAPAEVPVTVRRCLICGSTEHH